MWRHLNGVCATWFCKHVRGATGRRFWQALERLLAEVERQLGRWCLLALGLEAAVLDELLPHGADAGVRRDPDPEEVDGTVSEETYRRRWGAWMGRERELYLECARLVAPLAWTEVVRIGGATVALSERLTAEAHARLVSDAIPERLVAGRLEVVLLARDRAEVVTYSPLDPIALPKVVVDLLPYFDGGPTGEALRRIARDTGVVLEPALVRRLVDHEVLVPADGAPAPRPAPRRPTA